jgi:sulfonate transport system substrate-binding protein
MHIASTTRRDFLRTVSATAIVLVSRRTEGQTTTSFTDWGWPQPYERISDRSVKWLQDRGWWPLPVVKQPVYSGPNATWYAMDHLGLLAKRGVEAKFSTLLTGPAVIEAFVSGKIAVGHSGNLPFITMVEHSVPVVGFAVEAPNTKIALVVPTDSKLQRFSDLKGREKPAGIALIVGGASHFYFGLAAQRHGLTQGKDYILQNMGNAEMATMPKGVDALIPWEPHRTLMTKIRKLGREIDVVFPYNFIMGYSFFRRELQDNAPDVAQALVDAYIEAQLWIRRNPSPALELVKSIRELEGFPPELLAQQLATYNNLYKPTGYFLYDDFWSAENIRLADWLKDNNVTRRRLSREDLSKNHASRYQEQTYKRLGWRVPSQPPWIPKGWSGKIGTIPYPEYLQQDNLQQPQAWPEPGDLVAPWSFGGRMYQPG